MAEKQTNRERLKEITDSIERGIQELFQSEKYAQYLLVMSRFHKYSLNNTMLIYLQRPDATVVAGFNKWRDQFGRNVMKGEKGIKIIAPTPYKKKIEEQMLDPDTKLPLLGADGEVLTEEKEIRIPMFKPVTVFDIAQTDGKPLPQLASDLAGNVQNYDVFMEALRRTSPLPISIIPIDDGSDGYCTHTSIAVREGMSEILTVSATIHEIAHAKLHMNETNAPTWDVVMVSEGGTRKVLSSGYESENDATIFAENEGWHHLDENEFDWSLEVEERPVSEQAKALSRNTEEVQAESISFAVCAYYGIATGENSFGYIAQWSEGKELKELRESLDTINRTSSELITDIDKHYREICQERGIDPVAMTGEIPQESEKKLTYEDMVSLAKEIDQLSLDVYTFSYMQEYPDRETACEGILLDFAEFGIEGAISDVEELAEYAGPEDEPKVQALLEKLQSYAQMELPRIQRPAGEPECLWLMDNGDYLYVQESDEGFDYTIIDSLDWREYDGGVLERRLLPISDTPDEIYKDMNPVPMPKKMMPVEIVDMIQQSNINEPSEGSYVPAMQKQFAAKFALYVVTRMEDNPVPGLPFTKVGEIRDWALENVEARNYRPLSDVLLDVMAAHGQDWAFDHLANQISRMNMEIGPIQQETDEDAPPVSIGEELQEEIETPKQEFCDTAIPDPSVTIEAMNAYGYLDSDMLPLSKERALELLQRDVTVYMLYDDGSESMAFEEEDIQLFSGMFGVTTEDWEQVKDEIPAMDSEIISQKREQAFLSSPVDSFAIYQLKRTDEGRELLFQDMDDLDKHGVKPNRENYEVIYTGTLDTAGSQIEKLESIYYRFNMQHPQDFRGHSLSISDIVALNQDGVVSSHYVDHIGYKELPDFLNYLKTAEMQLEDDYGMIDGVINNGSRQPKEEKKPPEQAAAERNVKAKKPSVLAKLRKFQEEDRRASGMSQRAERDFY